MDDREKREEGEDVRGARRCSDRYRVDELDSMLDFDISPQAYDGQAADHADGDPFPEEDRPLVELLSAADRERGHEVAQWPLGAWNILEPADLRRGLANRHPVHRFCDHGRQLVFPELV